MATVTVTKEELDKMIGQLEGAAARLKECSEVFADLRPAGFVYYKAPNLPGLIRNLADFAARIDAEIATAKIDRLFGVSDKVKGVPKAAKSTRKRSA